MEKIKVPYNYSYCQTDDCPLAANCLRSRIWQQVKEDPTSLTHIQVVNPINPDTRYATDQCREYRSAEKLRYARGMIHLYDQLPSYLRSYVRGTVIRHFSSRRTYYYCRMGRDLIPPKVQRAVARAFKKCGVDAEPQFDKYIYDYCWD